jgi:hypothetical protein
MSLFNSIRKLFSKRARLEAALEDLDFQIAEVNAKIRRGGNITALSKLKVKLIEQRGKILNELASL